MVRPNPPKVPQRSHELSAKCDRIASSLLSAKENARPNAGNLTSTKCMKPPNPSSDLEVKTEMRDNHVEVLNEYCAGRDYPLPTYKDAGSNGKNVYAKCSHQGCKTKGWSATFDEAKQRAAYKMLQKIGLVPSPKIATPSPEPPRVTSASTPNSSGVSELKSTKQKHKQRGVTEVSSSMYVYTVKEFKVDYNITDKSKNPRKSELEIRLKGGDGFTLRATGSDKKEVEERLIKETLAKLDLE